MTALHWLAAATILTALFWVPYILERAISLGVMGAMRPVEPEDILKQALWAQRARRAHDNAIQNLVVFATLVLVAAAMDKGADPLVVTAGQVYFWSRAVHFPVMALGLPVIRTLAFLGGFTAQVMVAVVIFS